MDDFDLIREEDMRHQDDSLGLGEEYGPDLFENRV